MPAEGAEDVDSPIVEVTSISLVPTKVGEVFSLHAEAEYFASVPAGFPAWQINAGLLVANDEWYWSVGESGFEVASIGPSVTILTPSRQRPASVSFSLSTGSPDPTVGAGKYFIAGYIEGQPALGGGPVIRDYEPGFKNVE